MNRAASLFVVLILCFAGSAAAQERPIRYGLGLNLLLDTDDGVGLGVRTRLSTPINTDLSAALDLGLTGFIFRGRDDASYVFDPQLSLIVTLPPQQTKALYILTGLGLYIPLSDEDQTTYPTFHLGAGWVQTLNETTLYYEVNPALLIGEERVRVVLPLRIGIIF